MIDPTLTILIPCLDESAGIAGVIEDYRREFPSADILVVDNGSTDDTGRLAQTAGATVMVERQPGKANAIRSALGIIQTDLVLMVDGDGSYPAAGGRVLLEEYASHPADMITGIRCASEENEVFRPMHQLGMSLFAAGLSLNFGFQSKDLFSGLRLFSHRFYQNVPILSRGFELELELTMQAIDKGFTMREVLIPFAARAGGSTSKLKTFRDGFRILRFLFLLLRDYKPLRFFGLLATITLGLGMAAGSLPIMEYLATGMVQRLPLAVLATGLVNLAVVQLLAGLMLQSSLRYHREAYQVKIRRYPLKTLATEGFGAPLAQAAGGGRMR